MKITNKSKKFVKTLEKKFKKIVVEKSRGRSKLEYMQLWVRDRERLCLTIQVVRNLKDPLDCVGTDLKFDDPNLEKEIEFFLQIRVFDQLDAPSLNLWYNKDWRNQTLRDLNEGRRYRGEPPKSGLGRELSNQDMFDVMNGRYNRENENR